MNKRGFSIFLMFLVIMLVMFAGFFSRAYEMSSIGRLQRFYFDKNSINLVSPLEMPSVNPAESLK